MVSKDEECAHLAKIDRCSLVRGEADYHGDARLKAVSNTSGEYHPYVLGR